MTEKNEVKYCRDCFFARNRYNGEENWRCHSLFNRTVDQHNLPRISLVSGEAIQLFDSCHQARLQPHGCGYEGRWFKSRAEVMTEYSRENRREGERVVATGIRKNITVGDI